jgi:phage virion morphogenesis protein
MQDGVFMAGATFEATWDEINLKKFKRGLYLLEQAGRNLTPILEQIGEEMVQNAWDRFGREETPDGRPWASDAASTVAEKQAKGRILKILQSSGMLRNTINYRVDGSNLAVGSPQDYAEHHQLGKPGPWIIKPKAKKALAWDGAAHPVKGVKHPGIKARPFLGLSEDDKAAIRRILNKAIRNALKEG